MNATEKSPSLNERRPRVKLSPEELKKQMQRLKAAVQKFVDEGDPEEQKETLAVLMSGLAESRESNREQV